MDKTTLGLLSPDGSKNRSGATAFIPSVYSLPDSGKATKSLEKRFKIAGVFCKIKIVDIQNIITNTL